MATKRERERKSQTTDKTARTFLDNIFTYFCINGNHASNFNELPLKR